MVLVHTLTKLSLESPELIVKNLLARKPVMVTNASGGTIKRSNKVASASAIFPEWEMSIDLKLDQNKINTWSNVLALQVNHTKRTDGNLWRGIPAVYLNGGRNALHICSHVSNSWNHCWESDNARKLSKTSSQLLFAARCKAIGFITMKLCTTMPISTKCL